MSDDDSESDIETMFQDAHNNIARKIDDRVDLDSDVSDNDEKDKKNAAQLATHQNNNPFSYNSIKKRKANASDTKQQHLLQLKAKQEQIDKLYSSKLQRITNEDDDDDFLDDDDVKVVGTSTVAATTSTTTSTSGVHNGMTTRSDTTTTTTSTNTTKPPNYIDPAITLLDSDDDDDDDDKNAGVPATIHSRNIATTTASINTTGSTTNHRMMHHLNLSSVPSLHPQNNNNVMNSLYTAMIQGQVVPGMIIPPSSINMMMNQQVQQSQAISLQQQYLQHIQQQRLQSAVANLKNPTIISIDEMVTPNPSNPSSISSNSSLLRIKVIATIIPNQGSSIPISTLADLPIVDLTSDESTQQQHSSVFTQIKGSRTVSCVVDIIETSTIQILMDRILEHYLKLNLKQNVIGLRYNNEPMYPKHTLDMYRIPISGATIAATVQSSDTINNNKNNTNNHGKLVNASSFAAAKPKPYVPKGIVIHLLLRRSIMNNNNNGKVTSEEISMSIGNLDPLQILVDQYRQKHCHSNNNGTTKNNNKITLQFDGDTLILERTPKQYDMESDDLIDVIVS